MGNFGIRMSKRGIDVKSGDDKDMIITSKYSVLKGTITGSGSLDVTTNAVINTVTVPHNLNYIPMAIGYGRESGFGYYIQLPVFELIDDGVNIYQFGWWVEMDTTNVYLKFQYEVLVGSLPATIPIEYVYYIFIDKGNLN